MCCTACWIRGCDTGNRWPPLAASLILVVVLALTAMPQVLAPHDPQLTNLRQRVRPPALGGRRLDRESAWHRPIGSRHSEPHHLWRARVAHNCDAGPGG